MNKKKININNRFALDFDVDKHIYYHNKNKIPSVTQITDGMTPCDGLLFWAVSEFESSLKEYYDQYDADYIFQNFDKIVNSSKFAFLKEKDRTSNIGTLTHGIIDIISKHHIKGKGSELKLSLSPIISSQEGDTIFDPATYLNGNVLHIPNIPGVRNSFKLFSKWYRKHVPEFIMSEQVLFNPTEGYAGTGDAVIKLDGKLYLLDYKTGSKLDKKHVLQLSAYFEAFKHCFDHKLDGAILIHIPRNNDVGKQHILTKEQLKDGYETFKRRLDNYNWLKSRKSRKNITKF